MDNKNEQLERLKRDLALFLEIAERLEFPQETIDEQINLYLDDIRRLMEDSEND